MTVFAAAERPERLYRIEKERTDGTREFVAFVDERWVDAWTRIGCVATEIESETPWEVGE